MRTKNLHNMRVKKIRHCKKTNAVYLVSLNSHGAEFATFLGNGDVLYAYPESIKDLPKGSKLRIYGSMQLLSDEYQTAWVLDHIDYPVFTIRGCFQVVGKNDEIISELTIGKSHA